MVDMGRPGGAMQTTAAEQRTTGELLRVLGLVFGIAAVVGGSVGQGIFRTPGIVAGAVPDPTLILILWGAGAAIAMITAIPYAELGTAMPRAGGPYVFVTRGLGHTAGITIGWSDWLINISNQAFLSVVVAEFLHRLGVLSNVPQAVIAPSLILLFFALNWSNTRLSGSSQSIGSVLKGAGLLILIPILLTAPLATSATAQAPIAVSGVIGISAIIVAMRVVQNTYDGWNNCIYFCEEITSPERSVPRALFGGIAVVSALYLLVNVALLRVMSPAAMAGSNFPAADALALVMGVGAGMLLTIFGALSVAANLNLNAMFGPRVALAMARDRVLPSALAKIAPGGTPRLALVVTSGLAMLLSASGTYEELIAFNVALGALVNLSVCMCAWRMRQTEPSLPRPWRMPLHPLPVVLAATINALLLAALIYEDPFHSLLGTGFAVAIGLGYKIASSFEFRV